MSAAPRVVAVVLVLLGLAGHASAEPAPAEANAVAATWARVRQEAIPALRARAEVARARAEARERFFAGRADLAEAFPDLVGRDLADPAVVEGLLGLLSDGDRQRAAERVAPLPDLPPDRASALGDAVQAALDAEDRATALERRALAGIQAHLQAHPSLTSVGLATARAPLRRVIDAASAPGLDEAARAERARAAALADADLARLDELVADLRLAALVPSRPPPDPDPDVARLADPDPAAADRLRLLRPFLQDAARDRVDQALLAWLGERLAQVRAEHTAGAISQGQDPDALQATLVLLEQQLAELRARVSPSGGAPDAPTAPEDPVAQAEQALLAEQIRGLEAAVERVREVGRAGAQVATQAARRSEDAAAAARDRAAEAMADARDDAARRAAEAMAAAAEARADAARAWEDARAAEDAQDRSDNTERLADARARMAAIRTAGLLDTTRPDPDALFRDLRAHLDTLRDEARDRTTDYAAARADEALARTETAAQRTRLGAERRSLADAPDPARTDGLAAVAQWEEGLDDIVAAHAASRELARSAVDDTLRRIREVHALREAVRPYTSAAARRDDRAHLLEDLGREFALLPSRLGASARDRAASLRALSSRALDFNALGSFFVGSFWLVLLLGGWYAVRRRANHISRRIAGRIASYRPELTIADLRGAIRPLRHALETLLDLVVGWLMIGAISALSRELGLLLFVYLHFAAYRFLLAAFELLFARHPSFRPALRTLRPEVYDLARRTVGALVGFWIVRRLVLVLFASVLGLYSAAGVFRVSFLALGMVLLAWLAVAWEPVLRGAMARRRQNSRLIVWLSEPPRHWPVAIPKALLSVVFLATALALAVLPRLAREGTRVGSLVTRLGSYGLAGATEADGTTRRLPAEVAAKLLATRVDGEAMVPRTEAIDAVLAELDDWRADGDASLVVVSADAGEGKTVILDGIQQRLTGTVVRVQVPRRLVSEDDGVRWLLALAGPPSEGAEAGGVKGAIASLEALPPTVWLVEGLHFAFLRGVGGFGAIRTLLHAMSATASRHFWIVTAHRPAWRHLAHLGDLVDTSVVRRTVEPRPMGERELRTLTLAWTRAAGIEPDYRSLVRTSVLGDDPAVELERATSLFYRLLAEVSDGNPAVAMHLWLSCLCPIDPGNARVVVSRALSDRVTLTLDEMFVLAATRTHDWLDEAEVEEVTHLDRARVRGVIKHLMTRGLLRRADAGFEVPHAAQGAVTRALIQKNVVQWG